LQHNHQGKNIATIVSGRDVKRERKAHFQQSTPYQNHNWHDITSTPYIFFGKNALLLIFWGCFHFDLYVL
jgi:hypothetical protein